MKPNLIISKRLAEKYIIETCFHYTFTKDSLNQSNHVLLSIRNVTFKKMLKTGRPPNDWNILLKEAK